MVVLIQSLYTIFLSWIVLCENDSFLIYTQHCSFLNTALCTFCHMKRQYWANQEITFDRLTYFIFYTRTIIYLCLRLGKKYLSNVFSGCGNVEVICTLRLWWFLNVTLYYKMTLQGNVVSLLIEMCIAWVFHPGNIFYTVSNCQFVDSLEMQTYRFTQHNFY